MKIYDIYQTNIYSGEIWQKSQCLDGEDLAYRLISQHLENLGFTLTSPKIWKRNDTKVVLCLVDDIRSCSNDYHNDLPYIFDRNTIILSDNWTTCPTQYKQYRLPSSFFGIYQYSPESSDWQPDRDYSFSINRIDYRRTLLMLELAWRIHLHKGYVNFNCQQRRFGKVETSADFFRDFWAQLSEEQQSNYSKSYELINPLMPVCNYNISHDEIHLRSWLNIIVESYSSDDNIAISEKIFRALITPVPWTVYAGRYTVAYLESLGFDCLSDIVNHNHYDRLKEIEDRVHVFIWKSLKTIKELKQINFDQLKQRCLKAAEHNRRLLEQYHQQWPDDLTGYLETLTSQLKI